MMARPPETIERRFLYLVLPSALQAALPFLILPLTTLVLTPEDYGVLALATGITGTVGALASLGSGLVLAQAFADGGGRQRQLVGTVTVMVAGFSIALGALVAVGYFLSRDHFALVAALPAAGLMLALVDLVAGNLWGVAGTVCTLTRTARPFAIFMTLRAVVTPAAVLAALFAFGIHDAMALFIGQAVGGLVLLAGVIAVLRPYFGGGFSRAAAVDLIRTGGWMGLANVFEMSQRLVERGMLASVGGLDLTGLFAHAQTYGNMLMTGIRPALQASFPAILEEARPERPSFPRARPLVHLITVAMTLPALVMALVGREFISLLTNDRFTAAAPYAALLIGVALARLGGRPQQAVLVGAGRGRLAALANGIASGLGLALMLVLIPAWQVYGAVLALLAHALGLIGVMVLASRRIKPSPYLDAPALAGLIMTALVVAAVETWTPSFLPRAAIALALAVAGGGMAVVLLRRGLRGRAGELAAPPAT